MKHCALLLLLFVSFLLINPAFADEQRYEESLPIGLTAEEMTRLHEIGMYHDVTDAPVGNIRNCSEWEPSEGVIIRYPLGISVAIVAEMSEDMMVTTIVASSSYETQARNAYTSGGVNMANTEFIIASTNSYWTRDYGPWFIFVDDEMAIVDHVYNRPRPLDDLIPGVIGSEWSMDVYGMDLNTAGGNHMSNGLGTSMSTELVYDENSSLTEAEVDSIMLAYLGNDYDVLDYIESGGIHHIDCWAKFLSPAKIMVKDVPSYDPSYGLLNARAAYLSSLMSPWGRPYEVVRVYCPSGTAYTNSLILGDKVLVPIFSSSWDDEAIEAYENAMPGYEVLGFTGSWYDDDALHCRTMGVPDRGMLRIKHVPLADQIGSGSDYFVSTMIEACSGFALIGDSLKIIYNVNDGPYQSVALTSTAQPDSFVGNIPAQSVGAEIAYYLKAADYSGRVETHPYIGAPDAHIFTVLADTTLPVVSIDMIPDNTPVIVPRGGSIDFTGILTNNTGSAQSVDVGIYLKNVPWGGWYGPVAVYYNIPLSPYEVYTDPNASQYIPGNAILGNYTYIVFCGDYPSAVYDSAWFDFTITSGITGGSDDWNVSAWNREEDGIIPYTTELIGNYPNPFNAQTTIVFNLYSDSHVDLNVYNILGEKIETLLNSEQNAGRHSVNWNAESYSSGIYFYKLLTGESVVSKRMVLLK